ncbi:acyl-CoA N-acyltransferase [Xylariaceae sp. FL0255]|nr:acyl-CoA N-acyltransferase [Xylariaceae sp. FL0255]
MDLKGLRLAGLDDLAAIEHVVKEAYSPWVNVIGREPGPMLDDYSAHIRAERVSIVETAGGNVQAILVLIPEPDSMLLDNVAVSPSAQGTGLGRRLITYAESRAREAGYNSIKLYTHEKMESNISCYSRIGYVETHRAEEKGLRRVYMMKTLGCKLD